MSNPTVGELRAALSALRNGETARIVDLLGPVVRSTTEAHHAAPAFPDAWQTSARVAGAELAIAVEVDGTPLLGALVVDHTLAERLGLAYANSRTAAMQIAATPSGARVTLPPTVLEQLIRGADAGSSRIWRDRVAQSIRRQALWREQVAVQAPGVRRPTPLQSRLREIMGEPTTEALARRDHLDVTHAQQVLREFVAHPDGRRLESRRSSPEFQEESLRLVVPGEAELTVTRYEPAKRTPLVRLTLPGTGYDWEPADWGADFLRALDARRDEVRQIPGRYEITLAGVDVALPRLGAPLWHLDGRLRRRRRIALVLALAWPVGYALWLAWVRRPAL